MQDAKPLGSILVIDDDPGIQNYLKRILEKAGYAVRATGDGRKGVEAYRKERAGLVITDLFMDEQDGLETIRRLRSHDPEVVIVAITGGSPHFHGDYLALATRLGAVATMTKPLDSETVLKTVQQLLA